ncbi:unnamed protein product [Coregonus sp. 'balchen']|nr:unnamed protein product [Coregonus sp. 'balchen']
MGVITVSVLACVLLTLLGTGALPHNHHYTCPSGYTGPDSTVPHCYRFVRKQMGWQQALDYCKRDQGTLAAVHSVEEYQLLLSMVKQTQSTSAYAWVGLNDLEKEGNYVWTDGSSVNWFWSESAKAQQWGEEDCVALNSYSGAEGFDDIKCDSGCTFVCMRVLPSGVA